MSTAVLHSMYIYCSVHEVIASSRVGIYCNFSFMLLSVGGSNRDKWLAYNIVNTVLIY